MKAKIVLLGAFLILFSIVAAAPSVDAQTSKKKRRTSVPVPSPTPVQTMIPQVISRADEFPVEGQTVVTENSPPQTDETQVQTETVGPTVDELNARIRTLESENKVTADEKQKRLLLNLDILTRAETRAESLRKQLFEMIEKQNTIQIRIEQITYDLQPALIERYAAFAGSLRPEQVREARQKSLESERRNLETLQTQIQTSRTSLEANVIKADAMVEKLRNKLEKEIDDALVVEDQ